MYSGDAKGQLRYTIVLINNTLVQTNTLGFSLNILYPELCKTQYLVLEACRVPEDGPSLIPYSELCWVVFLYVVQSWRSERWKPQVSRRYMYTRGIPGGVRVSDMTERCLLFTIKSVSSLPRFRSRYIMSDSVVGLFT